METCRVGRRDQDEVLGLLFALRHDVVHR